VEEVVRPRFEPNPVVLETSE